MYTIKPHWVYKYLGRKHIEGEYDCLDLVIEILKEEYGKETVLFSNHGDTTLEKQRILALGLDEYSTTLKVPSNGCIASLTYGAISRHLGVYYVYRNTGMIIHLSKTGGAVTSSEKGLKTQGLKVIKYVDFKQVQ